MTAWQHGSYDNMTAWQHGSYDNMTAWQLCQEWQHGSIASTAALPAQQHCQHSSIASTAACYASMTTITVMSSQRLYQHCNYASMAAVPDNKQWQQMTTMTIMVLWITHALHVQIKTNWIDKFGNSFSLIWSRFNICNKINRKKYFATNCASIINLVHIWNRL